MVTHLGNMGPDKSVTAAAASIHDEPRNPSLTNMGPDNSVTAAAASNMGPDNSEERDATSPGSRSRASPAATDLDGSVTEPEDPGEEPGEELEEEEYEEEEYDEEEYEEEEAESETDDEGGFTMFRRMPAIPRPPAGLSEQEYRDWRQSWDPDWGP